MIDIPVHLIQDLHARQAELTGELQRLEDTRKQEARIKNELAHICTLLRDYPLPAPDEVPVEHQDALLDEGSEPLPAPADPALAPAACPDDAPPPEVSAVPTLTDCVDAILRAHGPLRVPQLQRVVQETYGLEVAEASLTAVLQCGRTKQRYVQSKQMWRLASGHRKETR